VYTPGGAACAFLHVASKAGAQARSGACSQVSRGNGAPVPPRRRRECGSRSVQAIHHPPRQTLGQRPMASLSNKTAQRDFTLDRRQRGRGVCTACVMHSLATSSVVTSVSASANW
jgi:hypothetical protein